MPSQNVSRLESCGKEELCHSRAVDAPWAANLAWFLRVTSLMWMLSTDVWKACWQVATPSAIHYCYWPRTLSIILINSRFLPWANCDQCAIGWSGACHPVHCCWGKNPHEELSVGPISIPPKFNISGIIKFASIYLLMLSSCRVLLKKSGTKLPRVELEEMGPSLDLVMRRTHLASDDLFKRACQKPKAAKVKMCYQSHMWPFPLSLL